MMTRQPTHPGEILKEDVLPALKLKSSKAAEALQISRQYMSEILNCHKPLTPFLCLKVGKLAGNGPELWMNMQSKYNLWEAQQNRENQKILACVPALKDLESTLKG